MTYTSILWTCILALVSLLALQVSCDARIDCSLPAFRASPLGASDSCMCSANATEAVRVGRDVQGGVSRLRGGSDGAFVAAPANPAVANTKKKSTFMDRAEARKAGTAQKKEQASCLPFFLRWLFDPGKRQKLMRNPGSAVMVQSYGWEVLQDRGKVYWDLQQEIPSLSSAGISMVWFPPPSDSADAHGYLPGKWYTIPHRQLLDDAMRKAKEYGMLTMVDVVLNHRTGSEKSENTNDWTKFVNPDWGEWAIVKDDWKCAPQETEKFCTDNCTCGAADTGENACFAPDIDHTNWRVQRDVIAWLRWLRSDLGFDAFRFDNTKGYAGKYTAKYVSASGPVLSVGEFFDSNRDLVSGWIKSARGKSRTFDFGTRYKLRDSVKEDTYGHLMDTFFGPMMWWDKEHAVTFLDNHDTAGPMLNDRFGDDRELLMGYAYILTHPGLPCIFWLDWMGPIRGKIIELVQAREEAGVTATTPWTVVDAGPGLYAAFVGKNLAMKLGSKPWSPNQGVSKRVWARVTSGDGWAVWLRSNSEAELEGSD